MDISTCLLRVVFRSTRCVTVAVTVTVAVVIVIAVAVATVGAPWGETKKR
jgi:hypothetical protein